jgi:transposase
MKQIKNVVLEYKIARSTVCKWVSNYNKTGFTPKYWTKRTFPFIIKDK